VAVRVDLRAGEGDDWMRPCHGPSFRGDH
jgi:hypothetical protein